MIGEMLQIIIITNRLVVLNKIVIINKALVAVDKTLDRSNNLDKAVIVALSLYYIIIFIYRFSFFKIV